MKAVEMRQTGHWRDSPFVAKYRALLIRAERQLGADSYTARSLRSRVEELKGRWK